jgi:putative hydrolase of the HAD superfamily
MESGSAPYTGLYLNELRKLKPEPTGHQSNVVRVPGIRAVLFDIYGTLLISASGDVDVAEFKEEAVIQALKAGSVEILEAAAARVGAKAIELLVRAIRGEHEKLRAEGIPSPEVDIVEVWRTVLEGLEALGMVSTNESTDLHRLSFRFELLANPVSPMPGLRVALEDLRSRRMIMGLVSNAQFFTPIVLDYFLNDRVARDATTPAEIPPFASDLIFFSFQHRRAKPDPYLFGLAREALADRGIRSDETLYVGNDMLNDVWAASQLGFKTVLFAGDARSLRLRENRQETKNHNPDATITSLIQLSELL